MPNPMGITARDRILARANAIGPADELVRETTAKDRILARAQQMGEVRTAELPQRESGLRGSGGSADIAAFGAGNYGADKRILGEDYNVGQGLAKAGQMGLTQVAKAGSSAGAWLENLLGDFAREGTNGYWDPDVSKWPMHRLNENINAEAEGVQQRYAENTAKGGKAAQWLEDMGAATVAAVPQAVAAILTGGASTAATAEQLAARAAASQGLTGTVSRAMQTMGKDPNFKLAFAQVAGPGYEQAKADGADDLRASLYAIGNGLMNAAVEAGGGIQTLPGELKGGTSAWKAWVDSMLDEGKEEAVQGVIERAMQNAMYGKDNPLVGVGKGAVLDPTAAAEEFAGGAVVGGLLGGGQIGVQQLLGRVGRGNGALSAAQRQGQAQEVTFDPQNRNAAESRTEGNAGVNENGLASLTEQEKINLSSGAKNKVVTTFQDAVQFVRNALKNKGSSDRAYMGKVPDSTARRVMQETGMDISGYNAILSSDNVRHIIKNHGDPIMETARRQITVSAEDIAAIPEVLAAPDSVYLSDKKDSRGRPVIVFEKQIGDNFVTMQAVSDGTHSIQTDTLFKQKKKSSQGTEYYNAGENADPAHNARSVPPQSSSVDPTVPQGAADVNAQDMRNGGEYARENSPVQGAEHSRQQEGGTVAPLGVSATQESDSSVTHGPVDGNRLGEILAQIKNGRMDANDGLGAADRGFDPFTAAQNEYGTLPGGENPVRSDDVPRSTDGSDRVSQSTVTFKGAKVTPDEFVPLMENETMKGGFSFIPVTNSETVQAATERIMERGWESSLSDWTSDVRVGRTNESIIATGALLYNNAVNSGKYDLALDIMADYMQAARNGARALQAARILKTLSPGSRLYMMRQSVARLAEQAGLPKDIRIDEDLERAYLEAPDDAARDAVIGQIQQDIADQLPSSILEKWVALRYTNMLGNFKTQARNVFGNVSMQAIQGAKDKIAAGLEAIAYQASGGKFERTKSVTVSRDLLKAAKADYANVKSAALGEGKYRDSGLTADDFARGVQEKRTIFKNNGDWGKRDTSGAAARAARTTTDVLLKGAEAYRKATNDAMEFGDVIFSKHTYARALAGYLKAHHVTAEQFSSAEWQGSHGELVDKARAYAIKQAQEATFRDSNTYSNWVSRIGRRRDTPKAVRVVSEGMAPFRKTPANVAVRAVEYSPLGLVETAVTEVKRRRGAAGKTRFADADITGADVINQLAKSLTGTGLFVLGMALRNGGLLRGGDSDDDREASFDDLIGRQAYSLELPNGFSYTLDWLSPTAIPLFMGAQLEDLRQDGDIELKDLERALTTIAEPMLQMSMLSSVDDTLNKLKYSEDNLGQMLVTQALSYLTQGLTNSLVGQIERISEDVSMRTYKDKNSPLPNWLQGEIGRASAKTPGWDYNQIPYIDAWGREQETGDILTRILINAASPGYVSKVEMDSVEQELSRLGKLVGSSVYPDKADKSFDVNGETKNLTAQEYVKYAKTLGQNRHRMLEQAMQLPGYKAMKSADKAKMISTMYEYANAKAKKTVAPKFTMTTEMEKYAEAEKAGISPAEWYVLKKRADADGNGSINKTEAKNAMSAAGLTQREKALLWPLFNKQWGEKNPYK